MKATKKILAFTISELIIVLILTSIIVGLAFSVLTLVNKQIIATRKNYDKKLEIEKLQMALFIDFNKFSNTNFKKNSDELLFYNNLNRVNYKFFENHVLRDKDTIFVAIANKLLFFNGKPIFNGKIDAIKIETSKAFNETKIFAFRQNDASTFMN